MLPFELRPVRLLLMDGYAYPEGPRICRSAFEAASAVVLVFDVTRRDTFDQLSRYLQDAAEQTALVNEVRPVQWLLLANKAGEGEQRQVSTEEGLQWAQQHRLDYYETSCVTTHNVQRAFHQLAERIYVHIKDDTVHHWKRGQRRRGVGGEKK